jgi:hypothetical protein
MPTATKRNQGKTEFVREVLTKNPHANAQVVREEWSAKGHSGSISQTLVNKQRSLMGLAGNLKGGRPKRSDSAGGTKAPYTGKKRGRKPKSASVNGHASTGDSRPFGASKARVGGRSVQLSQIEADLDRLLFRVMSLGGLENIEDSLRRTRRLLYQALSGSLS